MGMSLLYQEHVALGATTSPVGRALSYSTGAETEHKTTRAAASFQDLSTLPVILIRGKNALRLINFVVANDAARLQDGQLQYTGMLNDDGTFFEDITIWRRTADEWVVLPVAREKVVKRWQLFAGLVDDAYVTDMTSAYGGPLALQGPRSKDILQELADIDLSTIKRFWGTECRIAGCPCLVDRAGYTGENGFELFPLPEDTVTVWRAVLEAGKAHGLVPMGGAALGTLHLEKGLVGSRDFAGANPFELGLERFVALDKKGFVGRDALLEVVSAGGPRRKLVGLEFAGREVAASGDPVLVDGVPAGKVTTAGYGYTLRKSIAMALVDGQYAGLGLRATVAGKGGELQATVTPVRRYDPEDTRLRSWKH